MPYIDIDIDTHTHTHARARACTHTHKHMLARSGEDLMPYIDIDALGSRLLHALSVTDSEALWLKGQGGGDYEVLRRVGRFVCIHACGGVGSGGCVGGCVGVRAGGGRWLNIHMHIHI